MTVSENPAPDPQHGVLCTWRMPDSIIKFDADLTPEQVEEAKARFMAAKVLGRVEFAPPPPPLLYPPMACPECGHSGLVHVGVDHCPVCELIWQATPRWRQMQERVQGPSPAMLALQDRVRALSRRVDSL